MKHRLPTSFRLLISVGLVTAVLGVGRAQAAQAAICAGPSAPGGCLNAWYGGPDVRIYAEGASNENFYFQPLPVCNPADKATPTCPFIRGYGINTELAGGTTGQIVYAPYGRRCVGTAPSGVGTLTDCNHPSTGQGGGLGTVIVTSGLVAGGNKLEGDVLIDRYWTNYSTSLVRSKDVRGLFADPSDTTLDMSGGVFSTWSTVG